MDDQHLDYVWNELGKAMNMLEMLRRSSLERLLEPKEIFETSSDGLYGLVSFANKGVLKGTSYDEVCSKIRDLYISNRREKNNFFNDQQKFPVAYTQLWGGSM
jgi:hypothetical protein